MALLLDLSMLLRLLLLQWSLIVCLLRLAKLLLLVGDLLRHLLRLCLRLLLISEVLLRHALLLTLGLVDGDVHIDVAVLHLGYGLAREHASLRQYILLLLTPCGAARVHTRLVLLLQVWHI